MKTQFLVKDENFWTIDTGNFLIAVKVCVEPDSFYIIYIRRFGVPMCQRFLRTTLPMFSIQNFSNPR